MPIICSQVSSGSIVRTDEYKSYASSYKNRFIHNSACHKYEFVNKDDGTNIQAVESFHNELKLLIEKRKRVKNSARMDFLN
ncbi:hypothetical protein H312_03148 [Anncaliia algerae PRA339]|uniref:ISXO2-like transposase domain-containing protein n=1 Tax=Anncaliia algerae PRA339 TaxID=1288291 RepID=A0A059EXK2_9MICR|nr:hypothetical protein H312_03148 [Anncaliia algerae PRA339]